MKYIVAIFLLSLTGTALAETNAVIVTGRQNSKQIELSLNVRDQIVTHALALLRTASYEADQSISTEERFQRVRQDANIHIIFSKPQEITVRASTTGPAVDDDLMLSEMLIPISASNWPDYVFVRDRNTVRAFAKYSPESAQALREMLKAK